MLERLFLEILNMSFTASFVICFVMITRLLLKRVPKIFTYVIWSIVLFRLICPFSIESIMSLMPANTKPISQEILYTQTPTIHTGLNNMDQLVNNALPVATIEASVNPMQIWTFIGLIVWGVGVVILLAYGIFSLIKLKRKLETSRHEENNIYITAQLEVPFVLGIVHPKIYLPEGLSPDEKHYILLHEQIHIKRYDHIIRLISFIVVCIHWFNPLVWVAFFMAGKDMEMSCDEAVIKSLGNDVKKAYSSSLLSFAVGKRHTGLIPLAFGEGSTKSRVKNVLSYKKPSFWVVSIILIGIFLLSVGLLTNPITFSTALVAKEVDLTKFESSIIGSEMPRILYADRNKVIFEASGVYVYDLKKEELVCSYAFESFDTQLLKNNKVFVFSLADGKQIIWGFEDTAGNDVKAYSCITGEKNLMEVSKELMATYQKNSFSCYYPNENDERYNQSFGAITMLPGTQDEVIYLTFTSVEVATIKIVYESSLEHKEYQVFGKQQEVTNKQEVEEMRPTPQMEASPIQEYAEQYVAEMFESYSKYTTFKLVDSKITALNKIATFTHLTNAPIELWAIEYRLLPDNIGNVLLAGGMNTIDGWITENGDMGKPILVFSIENGGPEYLGVLRSGYLGNTLSGQEVALRQFLEKSGKLPKETYSGEHILVKFPLSTGETCKLLLSQPAQKGSGGIWCVERWMDGNGSIYYDDPQVDTILMEYYEGMQEAYDKGEMPWLVDTKNVALKYTNKVLGQMLTYKDIELIENASLSDFQQLPVSIYFGYISDFQLDTELFHFDRAEWVTSSQEERMNELNLSDADMPNGFYIYNPKHYLDTFIVNEYTQYHFMKKAKESDELNEYTTTDKNEFYNYLSGYEEGSTPPFWVQTQGGYVTNIREQYLP
ncbi:M56 family metallopeptidase [Cellulosilyticum sp. WCF-2]|uniref:M56 family metallopeptidase n=1 Tax=Cellulosilyticum sp. WCF-2 TaxID=2497860 RepID=UPI000F8D827B|nr:M56 family metallopeptidase [Cellulosilyticum sp. WCF-2]QEH67190.1 hypothetical protein EKH84_01575 [Cellulosilyticum sp. WCF-2]